jgi:plastocyanin
MKSNLAKLLGLLMVLGLVAAACGNDSNETTSGGTPSETTSASSEGGEGGQITIGSDKANDHGEKTLTGDETEVEADDFYFEPTTIKAAPGSTVKLELANESNTLHNFSLTEQNIDEDIAAGENVDVMVTIPQSGFVEFFCKYHKTTGMVGQVVAT